MTDSRRPSEEHDLDRLLRDWHAENAASARAGRDRLLDAIASESPAVAGRIDGTTVAGASAASDARPRPDRPAHVSPRRRRSGPGGASLLPGAGLLAAALFVIVAILAVLVIPTPQNRAFAQLVQIPDGGRLEAFDARGTLIGPCPLQHTDVNAEISGPIVSVAIRQRYANPYDTPIEAVYTFPMSNRAAVHRMTMTIVDPDGGERVVEGEVKERELARAIYEQAKASGFVASLLEQERPNIFTQSVANIEPGATVTVEIGYLEVIDARDGEYAFEFPTVVGPRYIPGSPSSLPNDLPDGVVPRRGIVLRGPAELALAADAGDWTTELAQRALAASTPIEAPALDPDALGTAVAGTATYADGSTEPFRLLNGGVGDVAGRWFAWRLPNVAAPGSGFSPDTNQVPDASRITPMPVRPGTRAGHDLSISVAIDTGGVAITELDAPLHEVVETRDGDDRVRVALADRSTIPNRDFVLRWRLQDDAIAESIFTHVAPGTPAADGSQTGPVVAGGYLTMVLAPPARVVPEEVRPRELVFILDTSGSMSGFPIEKSKAVVQKAIDAMRPNDTFNVITFAGRTQVLWPEPRTASEENRTAAQRFIDGLEGGGGTEMMAAIEAALRQDGGSLPGPVELANQPADGRMVSIATAYSSISTADGRTWLVVRDGLRLPMTLPVALPTMKDADPMLELRGRWLTQDGERRFEVAQASFIESTVAPPMRIAMFFTDGYVGNDQGIIQAVRDNARSTRVFSLGIGNSVNRYLLDEMARHGRGAVDYVLLADGADEVVETLAKRIETPVLTDIEVRVEGIAAFDILPTNPAGLLPDLYDAKPILLHARYALPTGGPVAGTVVISGNTGGGRYERRIPVTFSNDAPDHAAIATLWGRAKIDAILDPHLAAVEQQACPPEVKAEVVRYGEAYDLVTPYTSFVAVEKSRVIVGGRPMLVTVPIELPEGTNWEGFFGPDCPPVVRERVQQIAGRPIGAQFDASEALSEADHWFADEIAADSAVAGEVRRGLVLESREVTYGQRAAAPPPPTASNAFFPKGKMAAPAVGGVPGLGGGGGGGFGGGSGGGPGGGLGQAGAASGGRPGAVTRSAGRPAPQPTAERAESLGRTRDRGIEDPRQGQASVADSIVVEEFQSVTITKEIADFDEIDADDMHDMDDPTGIPSDAEAAAVQPDATAAPRPTRDLDRLIRTLDRRLLMLALGATVDEVPGLAGRGLDGRPIVADDSVAVTMLVTGTDAAAIRVALRRLGVEVDGLSSAGIGDTMLVVGRVRIDRLLDLGELRIVRRVVPSSAS